MLYKLQYKDETDRQSVIDSHKDKILIEEHNLFANAEGTVTNNFLIFSDVKPLEQQLNDLNNTISIVLFKQEGIL